MCLKLIRSRSRGVESRLPNERSCLIVCLPTSLGNVGSDNVRYGFGKIPVVDDAECLQGQEDLGSLGKSLARLEPRSGRLRDSQSSPELGLREITSIAL